MGFCGNFDVGSILVSIEFSCGHRSSRNSLDISFFFFGGLGIPLSLAMLAHLFSYDITWTATKKEVERSNFFKEVPKILKR